MNVLYKTARENTHVHFNKQQVSMLNVHIYYSQVKQGKSPKKQQKEHYYAPCCMYCRTAKGS